MKAEPPQAQPIEPPKPSFRGRLHQIAFFLAIPAGITLVIAARTGAARAAATIYALALAGLYGTSAAYHRLPWSSRSLRWMRRLDHSMIFVLIAGTYTPFAVLVLDGAWRVAILSIVWAGAALGILLKMVRIDGLKAVGGALYISLGWLAVVALPKIASGLNGPAVGLLLAGGVLYTGGAIVLATHKPNPDPRVFGYHEIWHSFVVAAGVCHYALIFSLVRAG